VSGKTAPVSRAAKVSRATFHLHFRSKAEIVVELMRDVEPELADALAHTLKGSASTCSPSRPPPPGGAGRRRHDDDLRVARRRGLHAPGPEGL